MAFQMYDDILDLVGDTKETGKPKGNDIKEGIITIPFILALRKNATFAKNARKIMSAETIKTADIKKIIDEIISLGGIDDTRAWIDRYLQKAHTMLEPLPDIREKEIFHDIMLTLEK